MFLDGLNGVGGLLLSAWETSMDCDRIVDLVVEQYRESPVDMLGNGDATGEYEYVLSHRDSYVRTVRDIDRLLASDGRRDARILEIGSFLGALSIALKRVGYAVCALDIPEYADSPSLRALYEREGIAYRGHNLRRGGLPFDSESFGAVILCEVLEHLNFNPLAVLQEVNRVLKPGGYIYIGLPNPASFHHRLALLRGRSIHNPIEDFFLQLDRRDNMIVGLHWREYAQAETVEMIERMGFETVEKYYFMESDRGTRNPIRRLLRRAIFCLDSLKPFHVVVGRKVASPQYDFWFTEANT